MPGQMSERDAKHSRVFVGMERLLCSPDELVEMGLLACSFTISTTRWHILDPFQATSC
jgi:hypothetical protein